jgi:ATP-dependent DNA helicase RecG
MVSLLRAEGNDTAAIEAKPALGGLPGNLASVLSAFANRPGGGTLILGLDETRGFAACGVFDVKAAQQGVAAVSRSALEPPVHVTTESVSFEGHDVIIVRILECSQTGKPVRVRATGQAFLRQYDGTYPLSSLEEQAFVAARTPPKYDHDMVEGSSQGDLDDLAIATFIRARRAQSSVFVDWPDEQILVHAGVMAASGEATLAGLLALGVLPQAFFPNLAIHASSWTGSPRAAGSRVLDSAVIEGPIPVMLADVEAWVGRNTATAIIETPDGNLRDQPQYPVRAVREVVANALIHRDLGPYALNRYVSVTLEPGRLVVANPGGLYGISLDALGHTESSLRNGWLAAILMNVRTVDGRRVIERLGSGVPATRDAMSRAGLPEPRFFDSGLAFTARLDSTYAAPARVSRALPPLTGNSAAVLAGLTAGAGTAIEIAAQTGLSLRQTRYVLKSLVTQGRVASDGAARNTRYAVA